MPDSWKFDVVVDDSLIAHRITGEISRDSAAALHAAATRMMSQGQFVRSAPPLPNVTLFNTEGRIAPERVEQKSYLVQRGSNPTGETLEGGVPQLIFSAKVDGHYDCTVGLPGVYHLSKHFGFDLRDFHDDRLMARQEIVVMAQDAQEGDLVDLEGDRFASDADPSDVFTHQLQEIVSVERETDACVAIGFEGLDIIGFPVDHKLKVERAFYPEERLGPTLEDVSGEAVAARRRAKPA